MKRIGFIFIPLIFNIKRLSDANIELYASFKARGIEKPISYLVKAGYSNNFATRLANNRMDRMNLKDEMLCVMQHNVHRTTYLNGFQTRKKLKPRNIRLLPLETLFPDHQVC